MFRNSEIISSIFGRSVTNENYITINLENDSAFNKLRILTFRKSLGNFKISDLNNSKEIINLVDSINKENEVNLILINLDNMQTISPELESYLINLNKKVLLVSLNKITFNTFFINREESLLGY